MIDMPEIILELANAHEGKFSKIKKSINFYNKLDYKNKSIKFQVFKYSEIATEDFNWFNVYKKLFISNSIWQKIFKLVKNKKIWIDVFDNYSLDVIKNNQKYIYGIKLQSSVLKNHYLIEDLLKLDLRKVKLLINVSGVEKKNILSLKKTFLKKNFKQIIIQLGFQSYPTDLNEMNIDKIDYLKKSGFRFFSYADHIDARDKFSKVLPTILLDNGYKFIEKHFCLSRKTTKYDYYSSLEPKEFLEMIENIKSYLTLKKEKPFNHKKEKKYLQNSEQKLVLNNLKFKGNFISKNDFKFKRTSKTGIKFNKIQEIIKHTPVLKKNIKLTDVVGKNFFKKKSKIGIFIICRLKSTRLKNKALCKIDDKEAIVHVVEQCLKIKKIDHVFLSTSYLKKDLPLVNLLKKKFGNKIKYILGDPIDVIKRILKGCNKYKIDTAIRVTGDCPVISPEIIDFLIKEHFKNNSDYTCAKEFAVGSSGEVYSVGSLEKILSKTKKASYSEYLPFYYMNNKKYFAITVSPLPKKFVGNHRLTLDFYEDLKFFRKLFQKLKEERLKINLINIFKILRKNKEIDNINRNIKLIYRQNKFIKFLNKRTQFKN